MKIEGERAVVVRERIERQRVSCVELRVEGLELSERLSGFDVKWMTIVVSSRRNVTYVCLD